MTVDFATYCCEKDRGKLYDNLEKSILSHNYSFKHAHVIHQRTEIGVLGDEYEGLVFPHLILESDYDDILIRNGINPNNHQADELTHGWNASHYWKHHCVNHLVALEQSTADYIVLSDADCYMQKNNGWIQQGIKKLQADKSILIISPSDGSSDVKTQNMSQQLFLCERERLKNINFDLPFEGFKDGGPMQEYYFMLEGRIGRYMEKNNLYRYILGLDCRYWHNQW